MARRWLRVVLMGLLLLLVLGVGWPVVAQGTAVATPVAAVHGIDVANMDLSVSPGVDFYRFANGGWLDRTVIPADRSIVNVFSQLDDQNIIQQVELLREAADPAVAAPGSDEAKAAAVFAQGMDMAARDAQGIAPIADAIARIAAIDSAEEYHAYLQRALFDGVRATLPLTVEPDLGDSAVNALYLTGPALGLPNRDYYLDDAPSNIALRQAYIATSAELLTAAGYAPEEAAAAAQGVYDLERALAAATMTREEAQDFSRQYNPMTIAELTEAYPAMDWPAYLAAVGVADIEQVVVNDTGYLEALPGIMAETPVATLRAYLTGRLLWRWADALSEEIDKTAFSFSQALTGLEEQPKLEERVLDSVNGALPDAVGKLYVAKYFPPQAKAAIEELTADVLGAFGRRLEANAWMTPATKAKAVEKLAAVTVKVGYPDVWKSYEVVEVGESFAASLRSALGVELRRQFAKAGQPVDRSEWDAPAQMVNAYYNPLGNEIVFPAGILQAPFFDYQADDASNYGAIGFVIGHEITHGFDLTGSQFDAQGNLANWWTAEDRERFLALNAELAAQYAAIEVAPGLFINGQITVGENAADLGGIQNAYAALVEKGAEGEGGRTEVATPMTTSSSLSALTPPSVEPPFTPEQRFFIAAGSVWRNKTRPEYLEFQVRSDSHSPGAVRATQPLRNADPFYPAFGITPGDPMWLPVEERIVIW